MSADIQYKQVREQVDKVAVAAGRSPQDILLIGVSKTVGLPEVQLAIDAGAHDFGENRPNMLTEKAQAFPVETWHFIGNVQSRAIPAIVASAALIHSVYQEKHIAAIDKAARQLGKCQDILIEVNISGEESKGGCTPKQAASLIKYAKDYSAVHVRGLMTMAPQGDKEVARQTFAGLRVLRDTLRQAMEPEEAGLFSELSMGMSEDWPEAIAEGATMIRVGRAIFSEDFFG